MSAAILENDNSNITKHVSKAIHTAWQCTSVHMYVCTVWTGSFFTYSFRCTKSSVHHCKILRTHTVHTYVSNTYCLHTYSYVVHTYSEFYPQLVYLPTLSNHIYVYIYIYIYIYIILVLENCGRLTGLMMRELRKIKLS